MMKVVICKPDLDTRLTALILGVSDEDEVIAIRGEASKKDLNDANVLCIEVGGSGQVDRYNFDHHETETYWPANRPMIIPGGRGGGPQKLDNMVSSKPDPKVRS